MIEKRCSKCRELKESEEFGIDRNRKGGLYAYCRQCVRKSSAKFRLDNPGKDRESSAKYRRENPEKRKQSVRKYCDDNKVRLNKVAEQYRKDHPDKRRESTARYYANNKEKVTAANNKWAAVNPERARARFAKYHIKNRERINIRSAQWRVDNPGKATAQAAKRRAAKRNASPSWADNQYIEDLYINCREAEGIFGNIGLDVKFNVDHIIPLQHDLVCGLHVEGNLQILTQFENYSKNNQFTPGCQ